MDLTWFSNLKDAFYQQHPAWQAQAEAARVQQGEDNLPMCVEAGEKMAEWARKTGRIAYEQYLELMTMVSKLDDLLALYWKEYPELTPMRVAHILRDTSEMLRKHAETNPEPYLVLGVWGELGDVFGGNQYVVLEDHLDDTGQERTFSIYAGGCSAKRLVATWCRTEDSGSLRYLLPGPWIEEVHRVAQDGE